MRKLTRKNLDELAKGMPVISELGQRRFVGGGYSTGITGVCDCPEFSGSGYTCPSDCGINTIYIYRLSCSYRELYWFWQLVRSSL